jgi:hypothetical protein
MTEAASTLTRHDLEAKIIKHCWEDEAFRKEFTADAAGTFVKYLEVPAADLPKIVIHEEPPGSWHIVLPPRPTNMGELSEQDLERVAGGFTPQSASLIAFIASVAASGAASAGVTASAVVTKTEVGW